MRRGRWIRVAAVVVAACALGIAMEARAATVAPELSKNLLKNPGFEDGVITYDDEGSVKVQVHWTPWWITGSPDDQAQGYGLTPVFYYGDRDADDRQVKEGKFSQYWVWHWGTGTAGIYQQVTVPANSRVRFQVFGYGWSCNPSEIGTCPDWSKHPSPLRMQIGLDPTGGTDWFGGSIVRSGEQNAYDSWQYFVVEADTGSSTTVTAFLKAGPDWPMEWNQVFWDDAYLVLIAPEESLVLPRPAPSPQQAVAGGDTTVEATTRVSGPVPSPGTYVVRSDDTLNGIARANGTTVAALIQLNGNRYPGLLTNPNLLVAGWALQIPGEGGSAGTAQVGGWYTVQAGDTLTQIAAETGVDVRALLSLNVGRYPSLWSEPEKIREGWVLRLE